MPVLQQVMEHPASIEVTEARDIGVAPWLSTLIRRYECPGLSWLQEANGPTFRAPRRARRGARRVQPAPRRTRFGRGCRRRSGGRARHREDATPRRARGSLRCARAPRAERVRIRARARPAFLGVRRCARGIHPGTRSARARLAGRGRPNRARPGVPVALRARGGSPAGIPQALQEPPRGVRPARTACVDHPRSACARRPALGGHGFHRTVGRIATPAACVGADGSRHASTSAAGATVGGARERPSRRCASSNRASPAQPLGVG